MATWNNSGSSSTSWEGIEGFKPTWVGPIKPNTATSVRDKQTQALASGEDLAKQYGFIFGKENINQLYQDAVKAQYDELEGTAKLARDNSLVDYGAQYDQYLQTMREQKAKGAQTGIMKGANLANEVSSLLGTQDKASEVQTQYAQDLAAIGDARGTAAYAAQVDAMKYNNELGNLLGTLGMAKYGYDVQDEASYLAYLGQQGANEAAMQQANAVWNQTQGQMVRKKTNESSQWASSGSDNAGSGYGGGSSSSGSGSGGSGGANANDPYIQALMNENGWSADQAYLYANASDKQRKALEKEWASSAGVAKLPGVLGNIANSLKPQYGPQNYVPNKTGGNTWSQQGSWAGANNGLFMPNNK